MKYKVHYFCFSHIGRIRTINQDNFICNGRYMDGGAVKFPLTGSFRCGRGGLFGVFDGLGGEECGEVSSFLAAKEAAALRCGGLSPDELADFCGRANQRICEYAEKNGISSTGSTAALISFSEEGIGICNIGDSKIFRYADGILEQLSEDHVTIAPYGLKPPLMQYLGIPPSELLIAPYTAQKQYRDEDIYLICSDGLVDMLSQEDIVKILGKPPFEQAAERLLDSALAAGGKDNITAILCKVKAVRGLFSGRQFYS